MAEGKSVLELAYCEDGDMQRFFDIVSDAFGTEHEYFNMVFPKHETSEGRPPAGKRMLAMKKADPNFHFLKVTDPATKEIIGVAKWNIYDGVIPEEGGMGTTEFWENEEEAKYADHLYREYLIERRKKIKESDGHICCLDILAVDPKHHYRGAGRLLVDWGTKKADEMDVESVVEASVYGRHLYETCGFKNIKFVTLQPPENKKHRPMRQRFFWMVRPKTSQAST